MRDKAVAEAAKVLEQARSVLLFPHVTMDGDALGSAAALCAALRKLGKTAHVVIEDEIPETIAFLDRGYCTGDLGIVESPDVCVCVDCGEAHRFPRRKALFESGATRVCVDHHESTKPFVEHNCIDAKASATAEIAYDLILALGVEMDREIGEAIYAGILTDTGRFQYSNTSKTTHLIAAALYDCGIDAAGIAIRLYQNVSREKLLLGSRIMGSMEIFAEGRAAMACMTRDMLKDTGARPEEADGVVEELRNIRGVEVACLLKERDPGLVKVSLRSKRYVDVLPLSERHGGGGHARAAGYSLRMPLDEAKETLRQDMGALF
ncbi:MAG: DHH family phosphoesterase [Clostridiales Family XIII bacterium]|nr:DHH family phosphoesterase [Clostridiales Family XIII bacterium]